MKNESDSDPDRKATAPSPPKGYRPAIPLSVRFDVILRQEGKCIRCGQKLHAWKDVNLDHRPPLQLRGWDEEKGDTIPPANDPAAIDAIHKDCHAVLTTGKRGESKLSKRGGDVSEIARLRRLEKKHQAFRDKLLTKATDSPDSGEADPEPNKKRPWPKRPMPSRPFPKRKKGTTRDREDE